MAEGFSGVGGGRSAATVSVVIPTRDRAERVGEAVASVLAQTRPADEVWVVDDGSTDGTPALLRERFGGAIEVVETPPRGVSAARNEGLRRAGGDWIAFLDSDDLWQPTKLERQLAALADEADDRGQPYRACHCDEIWIRRGRRVNPRRRHRKRGGWIFHHALPLCVISPSAVVLQRSVLDEIGGFDESYPACEDYELWLRLTSRYPILYLDEPLVVKHGGHADQLSRTVPALDRYRIRALSSILEAGYLSPSDHRAASLELQRKIAIYAPGAERRGRVAEAASLRRLAAKWASQVEVEAGADRGAQRRRTNALELED